MLIRHVLYINFAIFRQPFVLVLLIQQYGDCWKRDGVHPRLIVEELGALDFGQL